MSTHESIIKAHEAFGFKREGVCHGISIRWLEACILGEEKKFLERIKLIEKEELDKLTDEEYDDLSAFFQSIELFLMPIKHLDVFNSSFQSQNNIEASSKIASSSNILALGGLTRIYSEPIIKTQDEIKQYLDELNSVLQEIGDLKEPIGISLSNVNHTLMLTYNSKVGWRFMDINQYPPTSFALKDTKELAKYINRGLGNNKKENDPIAFSPTVITTKNNPQLLKLTDSLEKFKKSHKITQELAAKDHDGVGMTFMAARYGEDVMVEELAQQGANLDQAELCTGSTPSCIAAQEGYASVISILAKHGADLNKLNNQKWAPLHIAAHSGHVAVVTELAKNHANLDLENGEGMTAVHLSVLRNHPDHIPILAQYKANLNKPNQKGMTPALLAACLNKSESIAMLMRYEKNLNAGCTISTTTLREYAQIYGDNVRAGIEMFIDTQSGNEREEISITPYQAAVFFGNEEIVQYLSKQALQNHIDEIKPSQQKKTIEKLDKLSELMKKKNSIELNLRESNSFLTAIKQNDEKILGRSYFLDVIRNHQTQYELILTAVTGTVKDRLLKNEGELRHSKLTSKILYGLSCVTAPLTSGYRAVMSKNKQEYLESFLPGTLDSQCKADLKKITIDAQSTFQKQLENINLELEDLKKQLLDGNENLKPFLGAISSDNLANLTKEQLSVLERAEKIDTERLIQESVKFKDSLVQHKSDSERELQIQNKLVD